MVKEHESTQKLLKDIQTENDLYRTENNRLTSEFDRKLQVVGCWCGYASVLNSISYYCVMENV